MVEAGIDCYPSIYDPNPDTLESFLDIGARKFGEGFYLKTWILPLKLYGPEKQRFEKLGIDAEQYQRQLDENFKRSKEIMQDMISKKFGINYQSVQRAGVRLRIK